MARTWAEIQKLELTDAEKRLVECCKAGEECVLGDGTRPEGPSEERTIRAEVLRYLILGGCDECRVHELGVQLVGAWVEGSLDLSFATAKGQTFLWQCGFDGNVEGLQARLELLNLGGSSLPGLNLQGAKVEGDVFLSDGFVAKGEVRLSGAVIGGQLACDNGHFNNFRGDALNAQGAEVVGGVFLSNGFTAFGAVNFMGAIVRGQFSCQGGSFSNPIGHALILRRLRVEQGFFWREINRFDGLFYFNAAHVSDLVDDRESWTRIGTKFSLNGLTYDRIAGDAIDTDFRLQWLDCGAASVGEFHPQPYTHLAKVYRSMGRDADARTVLIERNRLLAEYQRARDRKIAKEKGWIWADWANVSLPVRRRLDWLFRKVLGYGYAPFGSLGLLAAFWVFASAFSYFAWTEGSMVPNSPVILTSADWQAYESRTHAGEDWAAATAPGQDWETFNPLAWGADLVIPILDLGQTQAWAPSTTRGRVGWHLWWMQWLLEAAGWIVAGLFAAAVTGIIRKDDD